MIRTAGVILAGGKSTRMGQDKALLKIDGLCLLNRIENAFYDFGIKEVFVSGDYAGFMCIHDQYPNTGPVGGICSAVNALFGRYESLVFAPVDLPKFSPIILEKLVAISGHELTHFENEPIPLTINLSASVKAKCQSLLPKMQKEKSISIRSFIAEFDSQFIPKTPEIKDALVNTNTPLEWQKVIANE